MAGLKLKLLGVHIAAMLLLLLLMSGTCSRAHLVEDIPLVLSYHDGPLLTSSSALDLNLIWYGKFSPVQRSIVGDFVQSLGASGNGNVQPSVSAWWKTTQGYKDASNAAVAVAVAPRLGIQKLDEAYSLGKALKRSDVAALVEGAVQSGGPPENISNAIYLVLTSADVSVERFCMSSCGFHGGLEYGSRAVPYAWVGNAESQCPGQCAWPFHQPLYGPQTPPLLSPNADVGVDGMIINIAAVLAGAVTNPFNTGFFQGDAAAPLEAVSACAGIYGKGAYPGFPGQLPVDSITGASYNADGVNGRKFLLPAMWDPVSRSCRT